MLTNTHPLKMKKKLSILTIVSLIFLINVPLAMAYTKQEIVNTLKKAGHAYWDQRVVIEHSDTGKTFYGYSGQQTVIEPNVTRYYDSDTNFLVSPHIFVEAEDNKGHAGVLFAYVKAYEATNDKFYLRCAKQLGDTLLQAQADNNTGGWWHDMGTTADGTDHGHFVNYFPWGGTEHATANYQNIGDNDGTSWLQALALLRLDQALPSTDTQKNGKYLAGAKWYADTIVGLKDQYDAEGGFYPYKNGGIPQMYPYNTMKNRTPVDFCQNCSYPADYPDEYDDYPHNVMITLNDDAMTGALFFLGEFVKEARNNSKLVTSVYEDNLTLQVNYLISVFEKNAVASGNSAWGTAYWIQDGSARQDKPTWLRAMEPPGFYSAYTFADDFLVYYYKNVATDTTMKNKINDVLVRHLKFWKYDAKIINADSAYLSRVASNGSDPYYTTPANSWTTTNGAYSSSNATTWYHWYVVNHDPSRGPIGVPVSGPDPTKCDDAGNLNCYQMYIGTDAVERRGYSADKYHYQETGYPALIGLNMGASAPSREISMFLVDSESNYDWSDSLLEYYHNYTPDRRFFYKDQLSTSKVTQALNSLDSHNFFLSSLQSIAGHQYRVINDNFFCRSMSWLSWGIDNGSTGDITDSDGDGYSDATEATSGSDPNDSESVPGSPGTTPVDVQVPENFHKVSEQQ